MKTILIVDDELRIRGLFHRLLKNKGYFPIEAKDGKEALQVLKNESINIDTLFLILKCPSLTAKMFLKSLKMNVLL